MISHLISLPLIALAQVASGPSLAPAEAPVKPVFLPSPAPTPPPAPGTPQYERERATQERRYKEQCYSDAGIKLLMERWAAQRAARSDGWAEQRAAELEVAEAAFAQPPDIDRLERARRAKAALYAELNAQREREEIALLRALPPADRPIYVREFTTWRPSGYGVRVCPSHP
jgi:hypothetical protein